MPYPLINATTGDSYQDSATFVAQPTDSVTVQVNNAGIDYQITTRRNGVIQSPSVDKFLLPGAWVFRRGLDWGAGEQLITLAFRSHVAGSPAQVSAQ